MAVDLLLGWKFVAACDAKSFFYQIPLDPGVRNFFTVNLSSARGVFKSFRLKRLPMGFSWAPAIAQRIATCLAHLVGGFAWVDNFFFGADHQDELQQKIARFQSILSYVNLEIKEPLVAVRELVALGMQFDLVNRSVRMDPSWVRSTYESWMCELEELCGNVWFSPAASVGREVLGWSDASDHAWATVVEVDGGVVKSGAFRELSDCSIFLKELFALLTKVVKRPSKLQLRKGLAKGAAKVAVAGSKRHNLLITAVKRMNKLTDAEKEGLELRKVKDLPSSWKSLALRDPNVTLQEEVIWCGSCQKKINYLDSTTCKKHHTYEEHKKRHTLLVAQKKAGAVVVDVDAGTANVTEKGTAVQDFTRLVAMAGMKAGAVACMRVFFRKHVSPAIPHTRTLMDMSRGCDAKTQMQKDLIETIGTSFGIGFDGSIIDELKEQALAVVAYDKGRAYLLGLRVGEDGEALDTTSQSEFVANVLKDYGIKIPNVAYIVVDKASTNVVALQDWEGIVIYCFGHHLKNAIKPWFKLSHPNAHDTLRLFSNAFYKAPTREVRWVQAQKAVVTHDVDAAATEDEIPIAQKLTALLSLHEDGEDVEADILDIQLLAGKFSDADVTETCAALVTALEAMEPVMPLFSFAADPPARKPLAAELPAMVAKAMKAVGNDLSAVLKEMWSTYLSRDIFKSMWLFCPEKLGTKKAAGIAIPSVESITDTFKGVFHRDAKTQLGEYLKVSISVLTKWKDAEAFWTSKKQVWPDLSAVALTLLYLPVSVTRVDAVFSQLGAISNERGGRINPSAYETTALYYCNKDISGRFKDFDDEHSLSRHLIELLGDNRTMEIVKKMLQLGSSKQVVSEALIEASDEGYTSCIVPLLQLKPDGEVRKRALDKAILRGHKEIARTLIGNLDIVLAHETDLLKDHAEAGNELAVLLLHQLGNSLVLHNGTSPAKVAHQNGHTYTVYLIKNLLEASGVHLPPSLASIYKDPFDSVLQRAFEKGEVTAADALLRIVKEVTAVNGVKNCMHYAADNVKFSTGHGLQVCRALLEKGPELVRLSDGQATPLTYATERNHHELVQVFLDAGADMHAPDPKGETPYQIHLRKIRQEGSLVDNLKRVYDLHIKLKLNEAPKRLKHLKSDIRDSLEQLARGLAQRANGEFYVYKDMVAEVGWRGEPGQEKTHLLNAAALLMNSRLDRVTPQRFCIAFLVYGPAKETDAALQKRIQSWTSRLDLGDKAFFELGLMEKQERLLIEEEEKSDRYTFEPAEISTIINSYRPSPSDRTGIVSQNLSVLLLTASVVYTILVVPYTIAVDQDQTLALVLLDAAVDIVFIVGTAQHLTMAATQQIPPNKLIVWLAGLSCLPLQFLTLLMFGYWWAPAWRVNKLLSVVHLLTSYRQLGRMGLQHALPTLTISAVLLYLLFVLAIVLAAFDDHLCVMQPDDPAAFELHRGMDSLTFVKCFYFSLQAFSGRDSWLDQAAADEDIVSLLVVKMTSVCWYPALIVCLARLWDIIDIKEKTYRDKVTQVQYLVPHKETQRLALDYYRLLWRRHGSVNMLDVQDFFSFLEPAADLSKVLLYTVAMATKPQITLFNKLDTAFLCEFVQHIRYMMCLKGTVFFFQGSNADSMYFIIRGSVGVYIGGGCDIAGNLLNATLVNTVGKGEFFGEMGLLKPEHQRNASVVALTDCEVYMLDNVREFDTVTGRKFPRAYNHFVDTVESREMQLVQTVHDDHGPAARSSSSTNMLVGMHTVEYDGASTTERPTSAALSSETDRFSYQEGLSTLAPRSAQGTKRHRRFTAQSRRLQHSSPSNPLAPPDHESDILEIQSFYDTQD
ncbi:Cyclic nucleotide-gated cation channel subunit A [Diplonema papillatum]|nr:Cyclic nucleotide-gated cation channel subunit A [Diplonema papillatum]